MNNANLPGADLLVGPNIAYADWTAEEVWNTGFVSAYSQNLAYLAVENLTQAERFKILKPSSPTFSPTQPSIQAIASSRSSSTPQTLRFRMGRGFI
ncbi:hypothetical protein H0H93_005676 [Arthromyces matolae]|nr:hypothetical protein H0H93_005676 [Arthromyces matolae]